MPTLDWIGKKAVENHHKEVPFRLLKCIPELSVGEPGSGNLLVQGDNLEALKALLPYYGGKVKCIYIDPPYNTGVDDRDEEGKRSGWIYSDNVNSPEMRAWLNRVVGAASEDLSRHDKWLCMMYPRLTLLREFLCDDGVIFISIDENEYGNLRFLMDDIFSENNRIGTIIWKNATDNNPTRIAIEHEYIMCYAKNQVLLEKVWKAATLDIKEKLLEIGMDLFIAYPDPLIRQEKYSQWFRKNKAFLWPFDRYKFIDDEGIYTGSQSVHNPGKEGYRYDVIHPTTGKPCAEPMMGYRFPEETMKRLLEEGRVLFGEDDSKIIELKVYVKDYRAKLSSLFELDGRIGTNEIKELFPEDKRPFDFPKPTALIEELLSFTTSDQDIVMDTFAGSGTTGHAVLKLNAKDGQNRKFILVEMKRTIALGLTAQRLKRVCDGYTKNKGDRVAGLGSGFRYCELGETLFEADGSIRSTVGYADLAHHVFFAEMREPLPVTVDGTTPLLGVARGTAVYLLYNGILKDKSPKGGNVLTLDTMKLLPPHDGPKVVYGTACTLGERTLRRHGVTFRQIPYEVKAS